MPLSRRAFLASSLVPLAAACRRSSVMSASIAVNDANWFFSPYNWYVNGSTYAESHYPGAYCKTKFSGTSAALAVDVSPSTGGSYPAGYYPILTWSIDGGAYSNQQLTSADASITLATGLANTTHTLELRFIASGFGFDSTRFDVAQKGVLRITGLTLDTGASLSAPTLQRRRVLYFGDSVTGGSETVSAFDSVHISCNDASLAYPYLLASLLEAEFGVCGVAGQAYGTGGVQLDAVWDKVCAGVSRLSAGVFITRPHVVVLDHGINGASSALVQAQIAAIRAAAASAAILVVVPWNGGNATAVTDGYAAAADANSYLINTGVTSYGSFATNHMSAAGHVSYAADITALLPAAALPSTGRFSSVFAGPVR